MKDESAVEFPTRSRIHIGLAVHNVERSIAFYRSLFGQPPTKIRPGYAKFEIAEPPVNLSLNAVSGGVAPSHPVAHFGVQVKSTAAVNDIEGRLVAAGIATKREEHVACCYAVQNKIWATDPDGNKWEAYVVLDNEGSQRHSSQGGCCDDAAMVIEALERGDGAAAVRAFQQLGGAAALETLMGAPGAAACCAPGAASGKG
jgi:catechol 2,3-dioxygenase-like lactoylglutathione lyase family enzyme